MAQRTKKKTRQSREKSKQRKVRKKEIQDSKGISRKQKGFEISTKVFFILKISIIIAIPIIYFVYSPLLVVLIMLYIMLFFLSYACENYLNKSVIKSNHIKIPKFDSAIALVVFVISLFGISFSSRGPMGRFRNTFWDKFKDAITGFGSLQTGTRSIFRTFNRFSFAMKEPPSDFVPKGDMPPMLDKPFSLDNIPMEFMFSQLFSTIMSILIFSLVILGIISIIYTYIKIKKFNKGMEEVIYDNGFCTDEKEIERILSFQDEYEESNFSN